MFRVTPDNVSLKRTIRPLYAFTQATPSACFLDPEYDYAADGDILPGTVMARKEGEVVTKYKPGAGKKPWGLAALFAAPTLGINEVRETGTNHFAVWVGGPDAQFEVLAPAFDTGATWTVPDDGRVVKLTANANGQLTPAGANASNTIAELIEVVGTTKIIVNLDVRSAQTA